VDEYIHSFYTFEQGGGQRSDGHRLLCREAKYSIVPTGFSEEGISSGYYPIFHLVSMHCDSWFVQDARSSANSG
jgi:hypothetical protein